MKARGLLLVMIVVRDGGGYKQLGDGLLTIESDCSKSVDGNGFEFKIEGTVL